MWRVLYFVCITSFASAFPGPAMFGSAEKDPKPLNLVDNKFFYDFDYFNFDSAKHVSGIEKIQDEFRECLIRNGVKKESFYSCVGQNYSKVDAKLHRKLVDAMVNYQNDFIEELRPLCQNKFDIVCSRLKESFNSALMVNNNPVQSMEETFKTFNLPEETNKKFEKLLVKAKRNYHSYVECQETAKKVRERALSRVKQVLDKTSTGYPDEAKPNPFKTAEDLKNMKPEEHLASKAAKDEENFNTNLLRMKNLNTIYRYRLANGTSNQHEMGETEHLENVNTVTDHFYMSK